MAGFGRSNSLSINTGGGSLFGSNTNASSGQQSAGLFGGSTNSSQPQPGGLFGSTSQSQQSGGLFGGTATSQPQSGGLFGQSSQPQQSGGLFGQSSQPQQSGGLFGSLNKPAGQGTGSLFGGSTAQSQPQQSGGLFGGTLGQQNQNQNQPQSGGLFGGLGQQQKPATPSLFGSQTTSTQQPQQQQQSLFGSSIQQPQQAQQQPQQSSMFGAQNQAQPFGGISTLGNHAVASATAFDYSSLKGTTRFSDLKPDVQNQLLHIEEEIQKIMQQAESTSASMPTHGTRIATISPDVAYIENFVSTVELGIENDSAKIDQLKKMNKADADDAMLSFRAIENLKLPQQFHYGNYAGLSTSASQAPRAAVDLSSDDDASGKPVDLVSYFTKRAEGLGLTLQQYMKQLAEVESHLGTMEAGTVQKAEELMAGAGVGNDKRELVNTLKAYEQAILQVATKVGKTRDLVVQETLGAVGR